VTALDRFLREARAAVDAELDRLLPPAQETPARLHEAMRYSVFAGGKRVRPALALLAAEVASAPREHVLPGAAALELIHTYSLVHDDLPALDDDDLRRGRPTVHRAYDEATAVLTGDALLTLGMTTLAASPASVSSARRRRAAEVVGEAIGTRGMIGGQMGDLEAEDRWPDDAPATLEWIHRRKTGALIAVAVRLGGVYAGASPALDRALLAFGERIGLLFQIADDLLDVTSTPEAMGKAVGKDAAARKLTYPGLFGVEETRRRLAFVAAEARARAERLPHGGRLFPALVDYLAARES
jgi:geranylgeranyl diphosphate synthase type II